MKRKIFYSWQSDLPNKTNRGFIDSALRRAITAIGRDETAALEPVIDRDTQGIAGSPDIASSIFAKIASADIFVADVSIVNKDGRPSPNPNVLFELGFAVAELGWENVILVMNAAFGDPASLPFDLRGRRVIIYTVLPDDDKAETRGLLQGRLEAEIRAELGNGEQANLPSGPNADLWWGRWQISARGARTGDLFINEVGPDGFLFQLDTTNGAHVGTIRGAARIVSKDLAYARIPEGNFDGDGELVFRRSRRGGQRMLDIEESVSCQNFRGMRGFFTGAYHGRSEPWFECGVFTELDLARLYSIVGSHYEKIRECTSDVRWDAESFHSEVRVLTGGVAGLYTIMESIVVMGQNSRMCCAYIDEDVVRYFSNRQDWITRRPPEIETWRERFADKEIVVEVFKHDDVR